MLDNSDVDEESNDEEPMNGVLVSFPDSPV